MVTGKRIYVEHPPDSKPVPNYPSYSVTTNGDIYGPRCKLSPYVDKRGNHRVILSKGSERKYIKVCKVVMLTFVGPAEGRLVRHLDDNKENNSLANLQYGTHSDNAEDARKNGKLCIGEKHGSAILNNDIVREIRKLKSAGFTYQEIENKLGVKKSLASHVVTNRLWKHVQ